jgi:hypothetical protein
MHEIITTMDIDATPRSVWNVSVDFQVHPQWNPFVRSIAGSPRQGESLKVFIQPHTPGIRGHEPAAQG